MNLHAPADTIPSRLDDTRRGGLAPWTYFNSELFEIEKEELFRRQWQLACHTCDLPAPGDWCAFDIMGERAVIVRGRDASYARSTMCADTEVLASSPASADTARRP